MYRTNACKLDIMVVCVSKSVVLSVVLKEVTNELQLFL